MAPKEQTAAPFRLPEVVRRLGWVSLFTDASGDMVYPLIAPFLRSMGAGGAVLGVLEAVSEGVSALVKWKSGAWADRRDRKWLVVIGYTLATLARPVIGFATVPWHVIALRSTDRIGKGVRAAPRDAILAAAIDPAHRAQAFGFHNMMDNIGAVVGPLMAFALARFLEWTPREIFKFSIVPGMLAVLVLVVGVHDRPEKSPKTAPETETGAGTGTATEAATTGAGTGTGTGTGTATGTEASLSPALKRYLAALFVFTLGASADSFLLLQLAKLGLSTPLIPVAWLTLNATKAATNMPGGRIADRMGHKRTLVVAWTLYAIVYALFPWMKTPASAWALMLVYGAYYGLSEGTEKAIVVELAPLVQRGRALGAMHALTGIATVLANIAFGLMFDWNASIAFWMGAAFAMLGAVVLAVTVSSARKAA